MKTNHTVVATHPAYGEVVFVIPAEDAKHAFSLWKQIVFSSRQWVVKRNQTVWFTCRRAANRMRFVSGG